MTNEEILNELTDLMFFVDEGIVKVGNYGDFLDMDEREKGRNDAFFSIQSRLLRLFRKVAGIEDLK